MADLRDLEARAKSVIDSNRYLTLGTADENGTPRVSPVYFTPDGYSDLYWVSSPDAQHSRNIAARPEVSIVVFDSQVPVGGAEAVYMSARSELVEEPDADLCARAFRPRLGWTGGGFTPDDLRGPAPLRLYRASVTAHSVHVRGSDPVWGRGIDSRITVTLTADS